jgi:hypothetical protein
VLADLHDPLGLLDRDLRGVGDLFDRGLAALGCRSSLVTLRSLDIVSIMWTGMRIVRAWSAIERVMAWRIHQVA